MNARKAVSREYWSDHSDPHKVGPILIALEDGGLVMRWVDAPGPPLLALSPRELVDLANIGRAESDLTYLRDEAQAALDSIKAAREEIEAARNELRQMLRVVRPTPRCAEEPAF